MGAESDISRLINGRLSGRAGNLASIFSEHFR